MQWWQWLFCGLALLSAGCSHALSPAVRQQIDTILSLTPLPTTPEAYKDSIVMLGGDILSTRNLTKGTLFKVLQKPLDTTDRPPGTDRTEGRFMALCEGYLDPAVYSKGRQVTLAWLSWAHVQTRLGRLRTSLLYSPAWRWHWLIVLASLLGCVACSSMTSPQAQSLTDPELSYAQFASNPEAYMGKVVIIAGIIIEAVNTREDTRLVLWQYLANHRGRPQTDTSSGGRFLALTPEYLETAIYRAGRALTVVGEVQWLGKYGDRGVFLAVRLYIVILFWRHAKCISGPREMAVPRCSTLALVLGSVKAYSQC